MPPAGPAIHRVLEGPAPKYYGLAVILRQWMRDGTYPSGTQIPTESALRKSFGVGRDTVRKSLEILAAEGWIQRFAGRGTFVSDRLPVNALTADLQGVINQVAQINSTTTARDIAVQLVPADADTRSALRLGARERVQRSTHVRISAGEPYGYVETFVPIDISSRIPNRRWFEAPTLVLLEEAGVEIASADQSIGSTLANVSLSALLNISVGAPLVCINRVVYDQNGRAVERVVAHYRGDRYTYRLQLTRAPGGKNAQWEDGA